MHKKLVFDHAKLHESHWKDGLPKNPRIRKKVVVVYFRDEKGRYLQYRWSPLKGETNKIVKAMINAEKTNYKNLRNPEKREDIDELKTWKDDRQ
jgi:hypothetical protein